MGGGGTEYTSESWDRILHGWAIAWSNEEEKDVSQSRGVRGQGATPWSMSLFRPGCGLGEQAPLEGGNEGYLVASVTRRRFC